MLPHFYYFNLFNFYSRTNYITYEPTKFILYSVNIFIAIIFIYFFCLLQFIQLLNLIWLKNEIIGFIFLLFFLKLVLAPFNFKIYDRQVLFTIINQNHLVYYKIDYISYINGENKIENYNCGEVNNQSPSIRFMYNNNSNKELLLIIESWGTIKNTISQNNYIDYIKDVFRNNKGLNQFYKITYGETCFHGNTSSAEGRELLNMNNEESYRAFLIKGAKPSYNIVKFKILNKYYTVAAFSGSKVYGSNWSNAEGFRRKLGFKSRFYFEELRRFKNINKENTYNAVNDEVMIDSLINLSTFYKKIFAYGLTINTHVPFKLDKNNVDLIDYKNFTNKFIKNFDNKLIANDQFYRISKIIQHTLNKISFRKNSFDKVLIIGDHASPELSSRYLLNQDRVPFLLIERK